MSPVWSRESSRPRQSAAPATRPRLAPTGIAALAGLGALAVAPPAAANSMDYGEGLAILFLLEVGGGGALVTLALGLLLWLFRRWPGQTEGSRAGWRGAGWMGRGLVWASVATLAGGVAWLSKGGVSWMLLALLIAVAMAPGLVLMRYHARKLIAENAEPGLREPPGPGAGGP